jgi:hypothetical protein
MTKEEIIRLEGAMESIERFLDDKLEFESHTFYSQLFGKLQRRYKDLVGHDYVLRKNRVEDEDRVEGWWGEK